MPDQANDTLKFNITDQNLPPCLGMISQNITKVPGQRMAPRKLKKEKRKNNIEYLISYKAVFSICAEDIIPWSDDEIKKQSKWAIGIS